MCMIDHGDDSWVSFDPTHPKARKEHRCDECRRTIEVGETYMAWTGLGDGRFDHGRMCAHCERAGQWLFQVCGGYLYNAVLMDLEEHWDEEWEYHSLWLGRAILGMRRRWKRRDGTLMAVLGPLPTLPHEKAA